ncbi:probable UDP-3-O-acyl-N-acetylglucosamine deacetylase 1, mitochondrial isoform X1 [Benincasa hispida]|uniref:probable UDP-3-O-acyl-N-acetylglucosamine deacetylase 1, mitochondrial isoform X1 n=1 Tax=Benincasa hispida TaxID=102211 RepID=UPI001900A455|nr:probable UDP-3-O-acyl-N-acetylglucosamine deacetylase 1, mitochondrial isoform X1 [Benincasa hispida]XP_038892044.1 probable UDP-3-O-acyl-N-acetylglucosamine deacetylase 1, mitochondrial isoform X2 [Benincasa hispida]XP_038892045.1 probable UDP-3-O-acyl-N-acetylglucosamine deacetylase 1, mitochondrial isoform X1 [Benincasa hispida]XP_038892046.1 probable UDP-3-O-acyl-N-acetylglucosamine deacetylase 1, mitochondrial isoform X1 [Benincasa hispida]
MLIPTAVNALKSSRSISWSPTGRLQQTLAGCLELSGISLHSGKVSKVKLCPEFAGRGRYFDFKSNFIPASIDYAEESPLCTTLCKDGFKIRTVEHLLSAMEAMGVDNCRIEIANEDDEDSEVEVPIFDGSAGKWVDAIGEIGLKLAIDQCGNCCEKMAPYVNQPVHVWRNDCYLVAFPASAVRITYGIDFPQVPNIGCQWFSTAPLDNMFYAEQIAPSRTFCIYEEVEQMQNMGLIKGGSIENALVCSVSKGWINPPLRFHDEPCRHKVLDFIGDLSLFAQLGSQGIPVAHIVAYKGGHAMHTNFVRHLSENIRVEK